MQHACQPRAEAHFTAQFENAHAHGFDHAAELICADVRLCVDENVMRRAETDESAQNMFAARVFRAGVELAVGKRARTAFDKGVECILKTQVKQNGKLTVWCAQHDEHTLAPAKARAYELPSLSGAESDNIVLLLMSIPDPSAEIIASVEAAIAWFKASKIIGIMRKNFTDSEGRSDYRMIPCPQDDYPCPVLWARFYTLEDNRPFFCDRDGVKKYDISEIGYERRNGYSWYNNTGLKVLKKYEQWKKRIGN